MFKKILLSAAIIFAFAKLSYSQERAIAYYETPVYPVNEIVFAEPMPATAVPESSTDMAIRAEMQSNDYADYHTATVTYTYHHYETTSDPVIRDFTYYHKVYEPKPTITSASEIKNTHPIRDFRTDFWRDKYYRDEFHNQALYNDTYKEYNYYK